MTEKDVNRACGAVATADLAAFLLSCLAADEQVARAAAAGQQRWEYDDRTGQIAVGSDAMYWRPAQDHPFRCDDDEDECGWYRHAALIDGTHIALHDPAFVLADIAAKKAIVEAYVAARTRRDIYQRDDLRADEDEEQAQRRRASAARCRGLEIAVESLAQTYKGRPGWSDEWSG